jgi:outer membrane protein TolC
LAAASVAFALAGCAITPEPMTDEARKVQAAADRQAMFADQDPLTRPLTLKEAFRRALAYNLDARVKVMEEALAQNDLDLSRFDLLPKAYFSAANTDRSNVDASSSVSITNGAVTVPPSTSTDRDVNTAQLNLSWNVLDFGVSYFNARQQANRVLVADEERRKVIENLLQDVRRAYWRAAGAQRLHGEVVAAIRAAQNALPAARKVESEGLGSPVDSLRYQKALLDLIGQLETVENTLDVSKVELASLINLPPGQHYTLAAPAEHSLRIKPAPAPIREMEETALIFNPDIREQSYQTRISVDETHKAILKLVPGITFNVNPNYDSNSFLVNHDWVSGAGAIAGYINNLLLLPTTMRRDDESLELANRRREAVGMAVLAKLHIAYDEYLAAASEYHWATQLADVDQRLYQQIANRTETDVQGDLERVSAQVSAVFSKLRSYQSYAESQAALGRLYATLGVKPPPSETELLSIEAIDSEVHDAWRTFRESPVALAPAGDAPQSATPVDVSATTSTARRLDPTMSPAPTTTAADSLALFSGTSSAPSPSPGEPTRIAR